MPDHPSIVAESREVVGKKVKTLRRQGHVPGVIYGPVVEQPITVTLNAREIQRLYHYYGAMSLVEVTLGKDTHTVYVRNLQSHPVSRAPIHVEFFAPNLTVEMTASVPVYLVGQSPNPDGIETPGRDHIELRGLPANLPPVIEVDISTLVAIDDTIYVRDLELPDNVTLLTDGDEMIARLAPPQLETVETEVEEAEATAAEEPAEDPETEE